MSNILLVTIMLNVRTGTEVVCCETARGLRKRGHHVTIYCHQDGPTADQMRAEGFQVATDIASVAHPPDVIQANQTLPLLDAIGRFPTTPAISICHDATAWFNEPIDMPAIRRQAAVDFACRDRVAGRFPHLAREIALLHNAVDLDAFRPRAPLPAKPKRALALAKFPTYVDAVREACAQRGVELSLLGPAGGPLVDDLPNHLRDYDLVFASARSALEALAVGCAVIVIDGRGFAGLVTRDNVPDWQQNNFGARLLSTPASAELIGAAIDRYDSADAQQVSGFIRESASLAQYLDRLEGLYGQVIAESVARPVDRDELLDGMGRSFRALERAWRAVQEQHLQRHNQALDEQFQARTSAREVELANEFRERATALREQFRASESALREQFLASETALRGQSSANEAALREYMQIREAELLRQHELTRAEFAAYIAWAAPRNLPRRIMQKVWRGLFGG